MSSFKSVLPSKFKQLLDRKIKKVNNDADPSGSEAKNRKSSIDNKKIQEPSPILCLPLELRQLVYDILFPYHTEDLIPPRFQWWISRDKRPSQHFGNLHVLLVCRQIYSECSEQAFKKSMFYFYRRESTKEKNALHQIEESLESDDDNIPLDAIKYIKKASLERRLFLRDALSTLSVSSMALLNRLAVIDFSNATLYTVESASEHVLQLPELPNVHHVTLQSRWWVYRPEALPAIVTDLVVACPRLCRVASVIDLLGDGNYSVALVRNAAKLTFARGIYDAHMAGKVKVEHIRPFHETRGVACVGVHIVDGYNSNLVKELGNVRHVHMFVGDSTQCIEVLRDSWFNDCPNIKFSNQDNFRTINGQLKG